MNRKRNTIVGAFLGILLLVVVYVIVKFRHEWMLIFMPAILGMLVVYLIYPMVRKLEKRGMKRGRAVLLIYSMIILICAVLGFFVVPGIITNMTEMVQAIPSLTNEIYKREDMLFRGVLDGAWPKDLKDTLQRELGNKSNALQGYLLHFLKNSIDFLVYTPAILLNMVLGLMIAYYFLKDSEKIRKKVLTMLPAGVKRDAELCGGEIHSILIHFIQGQLLTAMIIAGLEILGLYVLHVRYPFFLGIIGGVFNIIPFFGPFLSAIPAVTFAFLDSPVKAIWVVILFAFIQQIDNLWISPKVIEGKLGLHPITTILAVIAGGEFFGIVGMVIVLPLLAVIKVLLKRTIERVI